MINEIAKRLVTPEGFAEEWRKLIGEGYTYERSYDILEEIYFFNYGANRYSCYQSFYQTLYVKERRQRANKTT